MSNPFFSVILFRFLLVTLISKPNLTIWFLVGSLTVNDKQEIKRLLKLCILFQCLFILGNSFNIKLRPRPQECVFKSLRFHFTENVHMIIFKSLYRPHENDKSD